MAWNLENGDPARSQHAEELTYIPFVELWPHVLQCDNA